MASTNKLVLLFLTATVLKSVCAQIGIPIAIHIQFDVKRGNIMDLFDMLKVALVDYQPPNDRLNVAGHIVLGRQRKRKQYAPTHLIHLHVTGEHEDEATVFIAVDDLYVTGFANKTGHKFMLDDFQFFPDQFQLGFVKEYSAINQAHGLEKVPLGRQSLLHGVHAMTWHNPVTGDPTIVTAQAKLATCRFAFMVSESLRLFPIRDSFVEVFDLETFATKENCKLVHLWSDVSRQLLRKTGKAFVPTKEMISRGITDEAIALKTVDVVIRRK